MISIQSERHPPDKMKSDTNQHHKTEPLLKENQDKDKGGNKIKCLELSETFQREKYQRKYQARWKMFAYILDKIYFILYVIGLTFVLIFVFPKPKWISII